VLLIKQSGSPVAEIVWNLVINDNALRCQVKEYSEPCKNVFPGQGNARDEEVSRLKKERTQVKKERDFYKKKWQRILPGNPNEIPGQRKRRKLEKTNLLAVNKVPVKQG